jgi:dihydroneopterin aldolase
MPRLFEFEVKAYTKRVTIGCADDEQLAAQEVVFDVTAGLTPDPRLLQDTQHPLFDYVVLTDAIDAACAAPGKKILQEALAADVVGRIFAANPLVVELQVTTRKTERYAGTDWIGFRLATSRSEWQSWSNAATGAHKQL